MKRPIVTVVIVIVVAIIAFFVGRNTCIEKPMQTNFPGAEKHEVTLSDAVKFVQNYRKTTPTPKIQGGSFQRAILDKILAQSDCDGIRYYYAQNDDGTLTLVLVGMTIKGTDITKGAIADRSAPCPPWCDAASELN
jgi:uncharacterized lipoprotein NlpE involved in copper resistance